MQIGSSNQSKSLPQGLDAIASRHSTPLAFSILLLLYLADWIAPREVDFGIFYLIPIGIAAWYGKPTIAYVISAGAMLGDIHNYYLEESTAPFPWLTIYRAASVLVLFSAFCAVLLKARGQVAQLHRSSKVLSQLAFHDRLTGLPNRPLLFDRLARAISLARRNKTKAALMVLDLDGFKLINDQHGHKVGDDVLKSVAARLLNAVRETDTTARLGGDEFAIVLSEIGNISDAVMVAEKLLAAISEPIHSEDNHTYTVGVSIGISCFPEDGSEIDSLLAAADQAMYESKAAGKNRYTLAIHADSKNVDQQWMHFHLSYETGVSEIDFQHRRLVELANHLNNAINANEPADIVSRIFDEIVAYTEFHFSVEERLMEKYDYPDRRLHETYHADLLKEVEQVKEQMDSPGREMVTLQTLKGWLIHHIEFSDKALGDYLKQCGVS